MQTHTPTTPFGRRTMTLGMMASQAAAKSVPEDAQVQKWKVFQSIREARELIGATDRSLAILNALLSFHPETELTGDGELIVWPSNEQLMARANGMPATTLRRHLTVLVECGLIIRRDSPNGKRFARKGRGGQVEQAYGFDLSADRCPGRGIQGAGGDGPGREERLSSRQGAPHSAASRHRQADRAGIEENVPGNWGRVQQTYQAIIGRLPRSAPRQLVEDICCDLHGLYTEILEVLESFAKTQNPDANESHFGCHIQNSNPDSISESEIGSGKKEEAGGTVAETDNVRSLPKRELPLGIVLDACPNLRELAQGGDIRHWRDFLAAAELARPMLAISPSAWREACDVMGEQHAAITLAAIYQRTDQINSAGGYLRSLTDKAREGKFSTWPMVMALLRVKLDAEKSVAKTGHEPPSGNESGEGRLEVSEALLKSLNRPGS